MKKLFEVFKFEYLSCVKNKSYIITTIIFMVLILGMTLLPGLIASIQTSKPSEEGDEKKPVVAVCDKAYDGNDAVKSTFVKYYPDNEVLVVDEDIETIKQKVDSMDYQFAVVLDTPTAYTYVTKNNSFMNSGNTQINEAVTRLYRTVSLEKMGVDADKSSELFDAQIQMNTITTGVDQTKNYISTYIIIMLLYMAIILYGQMVSQSVVTEKNTRAMEMLITCARPSHLMFGKVFGSGLAGLTQLTIIIATALTSVGTIGASSIPPQILEFVHIPLKIALFALLFFLLGYFIYSFLLAAFASLASRSEDLNTLITPVMLIYVAAFMIVLMSMNSDAINGPVMVVCSYIPFTAPIAMFTRIALADVAVWEIAVSVAVQLVSIYLFGMLAASIYRIGVLLYGKPPKPAEIIKLLRGQHKQKKSVSME